MASDEEAQKARAAALRREIARVTKTDPEGEQGTASPAAPGPGQESPREFVHRRMRELERSKKRRKK